MNEPLPPRVQAAEARREFRRLMAESSLGCPREPISCGHMFIDHSYEWGDNAMEPTGGQCQVPGCDCDGDR